MLFARALLDRIASGEVTLAFRRWRRPPPRPGTTLRTAVGVLLLEDVRAIDESSLTEDEARKSGAASRADALDALRAEGTLLRIVLRYQGQDTRPLLRQERLAGAAQTQELLEHLRRIEERSAGPWIRPLLHLVARHPGMAARELAKLAAEDMARLKRRMRRLGELGLTESLTTGYRLSPRGLDLLEAMRPSPQ